MKKPVISDALSGSINNLEWDANGNLIKSSCISGPAYDRRLCWTEDNRLQGYTEYSDENGDMSAWYNYNAGGDRNFKITSPSLNMRQNAVGLRYSAHLKYPTLYASALITFNKGGYTKHYFEGTNRVCSKIGGGFRNVHWDNIEDRIPTLVADYDQLSEGQRESVERTFNECLNMGVEMDGIIDLYEVVSHESGRDNQEPAFFYHSDHLGSAAYLTNDAGQVTQTLNYLPCGEDWVDIQNYVETRYPRLGIFTYNGKEKDYESGFHYYDARYYWSELLTGWLSVDPMMDKYPSISPYAYCAWNPVILTDPQGMSTSPVFDTEGNLLGTDSDGYSGTAIVMDKKKFRQGMSHEEASSTGTFLDHYGEGISISEDDWQTIVDNGGERLDPTVSNKSDHDIYYKPEDDKSSKGKSASGAYKIGAHQDLYARVDGITVPHLKKGMVYKITDKINVTVTNTGVSNTKSKSLFYSAVMFMKGGWKDESWHFSLVEDRFLVFNQENVRPYYMYKTPDHGWDELFKKSHLK